MTPRPAFPYCLHVNRATRAIPALLILAALGAAGPDQAPPRPLVTTAETDPPAVEPGTEEPAVLVNPGEPAASRILGVSPRVGLRVYALTGELLQQIDVRDLIGVDARSGVRLATGRAAIAACVDTSGVLTIYRAGPGGAVEPITGLVRTGVADAAAIALHLSPDGSLVALVGGGKSIEGWRLTIDHDVRAQRVIQVAVPEPVVCLAASDARQTLYIGSTKGLRTLALTAGTHEPVKVAPIGATPIRGVGAFDSGALGGHLLLATPDGLSLHAPGSFKRVGDVIRIDRTNGIDPVDPPGALATSDGAFGAAYPFGLIVAHDADNAPDRSNLKLIDLTPLAERARLGR